MGNIFVHIIFVNISSMFTRFLGLMFSVSCRTKMSIFKHCHKVDQMGKRLTVTVKFHVCRRNGLYRTKYTVNTMHISVLNKQKHSNFCTANFFYFLCSRYQYLFWHLCTLRASSSTAANLLLCEQPSIAGVTSKLSLKCLSNTSVYVNSCCCHPHCGKMPV